MPKLAAKLTPIQHEELGKQVYKQKDPTNLKRIQAVWMVDRNQRSEIIEALTGYKRSRAYGLRKLYQEKGLEGLLVKPKLGKPLMSKKQLNQLKQVLEDPASPINLYQTPFWTTRLLADYIKEEFGVDYKSKTSIYLLFKKVKFTYHKPQRVSVSHNPEDINRWRVETTHKIRDCWDADTVVILSADEMILSTQTTVQKVWLPVGGYPQVKVSTTRKNKSIYGFLNLKTGKEHAFPANWQNMYITTKMLQSIRRIYPKSDNPGNKIRGKKILLFWDNPGWHKGSKVTEYIKKDGAIEVIYFPKYTPEENPQEHVWKEGRSKVTHNVFIKDLDKTSQDFIHYLNSTKFNYSLLGFSPNSRC